MLAGGLQKQITRFYYSTKQNDGFRRSDHYEIGKRLTQQLPCKPEHFYSKWISLQCALMHQSRIDLCWFYTCLSKLSWSDVSKHLYCGKHDPCG